MTVFTIANFKTHSTTKLQQNFQAETKWNMLDISQHPWKCAWTTTSLLLQRRSNKSSFKTKPLSKAVQHTAYHHTHRRTLFAAMQNFHQAWKIYQFSQGSNSCKEKRKLDTGTFTLGTIILINFLNRYSALSTFTLQAIDYKLGRVHQNFQWLKMENSNMMAFPYFSANAETTLQMDASKKGKDIPVTDTFSRVTPMNPEDDIQLPIRKATMITTCISTRTLMSVQPEDSLSNKLYQLRKSTAQGNQLTRLSRYISTESQCDKKSLPTDLRKHWNNRETLSMECRTFVMMNIIMSTICMITTQYLMSEHSSDSISNRLARPRKNTSQKKHITRLEGYNNQLINYVIEKAYRQISQSLGPTRNLYTTDLDSLIMETRSVPVVYIHKELYILPRPSKAMAQWKIQYMQKEVHILSRPSKLQPMADYIIVTQCTQQEKDQDLPQLPSTLEAQEMYQ